MIYINCTISDFDNIRHISIVPEILLMPGRGFLSSLKRFANNWRDFDNAAQDWDNNCYDFDNNRPEIDIIMLDFDNIK